MLLQSQLSHGGSVADIVPGVGRGGRGVGLAAVQFPHNSHACTVLTAENLF